MRRSRIVVAAAAACLGLVGAVNPVAAQIRPNIVPSTLWDNNSAGAVAMTNSGNILCCSNSQAQVVPYMTATNQTADDFTVPSGQMWNATEVDVPGTLAYYGNTPATYNVYIYNNNSGTPGSQFFSESNITPSNLSSNNASPNLTLTSVPLMTAGTYWLSVQANGSNFRWYWDDTTAPAGSLYSAQFQEPGGYDFGNNGTCASWTLRSSCFSGYGDSAHPDQAFTVRGQLTNPLSQHGVAAATNGTEGLTPVNPGYYLGSFQNSICNSTTQPASDYSGAINWAGSGTGSTTAAIATTSTLCVFNVYGSYAYYSAGTYYPTVTITETTTSSQLTLTPTLTIGEAALTANPATASQTCTLFASCTFAAANFTDSNTYCNLEQSNPYVQYTATVNFGDTTSASSNSAGNGPVQINQTAPPCTFTVTATHLYSSTGPKVVTTTICDESNNTCVTTSSTNNPATAPTVTVGTPPSTRPNNGRISVFAINYQYTTPYPHYTNFTVGLTEYHYSSGANIANLNYVNTFQNIYLSYCATHNSATTQCRARVLSFTCTATSATIYLSYELPNQTVVHYAELYGNKSTQTFYVITDNGAGSTTVANPPTQPQANTVRIIC